MKAGRLKILIVAYFFAPDKRVGALRASYWFKELPRAMDAEVSVITANGSATGENIWVVPVDNSKLKGNLIKDEGLRWKNNVIAYLDENPFLSADIVIITGSPFMQFGLVTYFKRKFSSRVILDYRDPFANNPGFDSNSIKIWVKRFYERKFNKQADALITVNDFCGALIEGFEDKPHAIVQNGYDETIVPVLKDIDVRNPTFSYTGKFYFDPTPIAQAIVKTGVKLTYAGPDEAQLNVDMKNIVSEGFVDYPRSVQLIAESDVAIVQTYGEDFQSTTKLFDYIRCKRIILIVSNKYLCRGSIHEELKDYPNVFWSENKVDSILKTINEIKNYQVRIVPDELTAKYSRKEQMQKLIALIKELAR